MTQTDNPNWPRRRLTDSEGETQPESESQTDGQTVNWLRAGPNPDSIGSVVNPVTKAQAIGRRKLLTLTDRQTQCQTTNEWMTMDNERPGRQTDQLTVNWIDQTVDKKENWLTIDYWYWPVTMKTKPNDSIDWRLVDNIGEVTKDWKDNNEDGQLT